MFKIYYNHEDNGLGVPNLLHSFMVFSVTYYLELHKDITFYYVFHYFFNKYESSV